MRVGRWRETVVVQECLTCKLILRRDQGEAPRWDRIRRTSHWDVVHAFGTAVEGWVVLVARRHITAVADMTDEEAAELGPLMRDVSRAISEVVGCEKTYVVQFAEHADHPRIHVHLIPRAPDLPGRLRGPGIFSLLGVGADRAVSAARMSEIADRLDGALKV